MKKYIQYFVLILLIVISVFYFYNHREELRILATIRFSDTLLVSIVLLLFFSLTGYTFKLLVQLLNVDLTFMEMLGLSILTNFANYMGPTRPGAAIKAVFLKSKKGLSYSYFGAVLAANTFIVFFMTGLIGAVLLSFLYFQGKSVPTLLTCICVILIVVSIIPFWFEGKYLFSRWKKPLLIKKTLEGFAIIRRNKVKLLFICLTFLFQFVLSALLYSLAFNAIGKPINFLSAMVIGVFTSIANFFTITPNNLGIQEIVSAYLLAVTGYDFTTGIIGSSIIRVIHITITFSLAPLFSYYLFKTSKIRLNETIFKETKE